MCSSSPQNKALTCCQEREAAIKGAEQTAKLSKRGFRILVVCKVRLTRHAPVDFIAACVCMQLLCRSP